MRCSTPWLWAAAVLVAIGATGSAAAQPSGGSGRLTPPQAQPPLHSPPPRQPPPTPPQPPSPPSPPPSPPQPPSPPSPPPQPPSPPSPPRPPLPPPAPQNASTMAATVSSVAAAAAVPPPVARATPPPRKQQQQQQKPPARPRRKPPARPPRRPPPRPRAKPRPAPKPKRTNPVVPPKKAPSIRQPIKTQVVPQLPQQQQQQPQQPWTGGRLLPPDRALDWSRAGYREGAAPIPDPPGRYNVRSFGAKGDGSTDDTAALQAVAKAANSAPGVVFFPPGVYILRKPITFTRGNTVLRGAGPDQSVIHIPLSLSEVYSGTWTSDGNGNVKSAWSSGGAFINFHGRKQRSNNPRTLLATISAAVQFGATRIPVANTARLRVGQRIRIYVNDVSTLSRRRLQQLAANASDAVPQVPNALRLLPGQQGQDPVLAAALAGGALEDDGEAGLTPEEAAKADAALAEADAGSTDSGQGDNGTFVWEDPWPSNEDGQADEAEGATSGGAIGADEGTESGTEGRGGSEGDTNSPESQQGVDAGQQPQAGTETDRLAAAAAAAGYTASDLSTAAFSAGGTGQGSQGGGTAGASPGDANTNRDTNTAAGAQPRPANALRDINTVAAWAYGDGLVDDGPSTGGVVTKDEVAMSAKVVGVVRTGADGSGYIVLDRGMPFPVRHRVGWQGTVHLDSPSIEDSGIEKLAIRFKWTYAAEHHAERGYNAIQFYAASNVWVRQVALLNVDNGLFYSWVHRSTVQDVTVADTRPRVSPDHPRDLNGHHGITITQGQGNLLQRVYVPNSVIHDITVTAGSSMNVVHSCRGANLNLDMHRTAPFNNLFANCDMGAGTRPFASGGRKDRGSYSGRGNTYWGLRSSSGRPLVLPACSFGPYLNFVGNFRGDTCPGKGWLVQGLRGRPTNLYGAQVARFRRG